MSADLLTRLKSALADRYAVESEIGRGGMAVVFLAEDLKHSRRVAIKVMHPDLAASLGVDRFLREIQIVAGLTHPHVLPLYDSGETDGLLFYVMPYVEGESLRERLDREKQFPVEEAIQLTEEVADALDHAHGQGVIHRDIKPANILLEGGHAIVADFGLARAVSAAGGENVTATGMAVGTPAYMSPEQASGEEVDERSDLYALGCILYEMLAGEPPLTGATPQSTAAKRLTDRPTPLGAIRNTVPASLQSLVERTLATSAVDRPATARQLAEELGEVGRSPEPAARRTAARWLLPVLGLAAIAVGVVVVSMLGTDRSVTRDTRLLPVGRDLGAQSIAVLPFANNTGDVDLDWLGIGLADMLISGLAQRERVRVVGIEHLLDLLRQAGREETDRIPEDMAVNIASASGARAMVNGSLVKLGEDFRLDAQVADLRDGTIISAAQAHGPDVFALVDEVSAILLSRVLDETITATELTPVSQLTTGSFDAYQEYQKGLQAERRFDQQVAIEHYQQAVELDSTFALAWLRLGLRALRAEKNREATTYLERAERFAADASERDRLFIQALLARVSREYDEEISYLEDLVAKYPDDREGRLYLSSDYTARGRPDDARRVLEEALELDPYWLGALNNLAYVVAYAGDEVAADSLSLRNVELRPNEPNPYDTRGEILEMFGRKEEARDMFREAIRLGAPPGWITPYMNLFDSYMSDGDPAGARAALEPYLDSNDPDVAGTIRLVIADTYVPEGRYLDATEMVRSALRKAEELGSDNWRHRILAEVAAYANATGAYAEAEEAFLELLSLEARVDFSLFQLLGIYGKQSRFDEMSQVRDEVATNMDSVPDFMRGRAESLVRFADGLIAWYRDSNAEETVRLFAEGRAAAGVSETTLLDGTELGGEEVFALMELGRVSEALEIIDAQERVVLERQWPQIIAHAAWYLRGRAYEALDEPEQALESYGQLLEVAGDGVREVVLFRDTPERVARLKGEP